MSIKKAFSVAALAAVSMMGATQAFAQAATQDVSLTATVPKYCNIGTPPSAAGATRDIAINTDGSVDTLTAVPNVVAGGVSCNTATSVQVKSLSGGVTTGGTAPAGFTNKIDYTASAKLGTAPSASVDTELSPTGTAVSTGGATSGSLTISVTPKASATPLVAGTGYADTLRVTLTPE
jgi:hypothetical protein